MNGKHEKCKYTNCKLKATKTWALVPLCEDHHKLISDETGSLNGGGYYGNKIFDRTKVTTDDERVHYGQIAHLIPWSKQNMEFYKGEKTEK